MPQTAPRLPNIWLCHSRVAPELTEPPNFTKLVFFKPEREPVGVKVFDRCAVPIVLADQHRIDVVIERGQQSIRVRRDNDLRAR